MKLNSRFLITIFLLVIVASPVFANSRTSFLPSTHAQSEGGLTGVIIPLWSYPGSEWTQIANMKEAYPSVPMIAVINPSNGPGYSQDPNFVWGINLLESAGVTVLGYVYTLYASIPESSIVSEINSWKSMYNVNGIFFDQMSNVPGYESYYSSLNSYAASLGYQTVGNPGAPIPASYVGTMDNIVIYENFGLPSLSYLSSLGYQKSDFSFVSYGDSGLDTSFVSAASTSVSYLYMSEGVMPNPYPALPSYFETLMSTLSQIDSPPTVPVTVETVNMSSDPISGLWTTVESGGVTFQAGFNTQFAATIGDQYEVTVSNYGNLVFDHWSTGSNSDTITITPSQATTLVAYYDTVVQTSPSTMTSMPVVTSSFTSSNSIPYLRHTLQLVVAL